MRAKYSKGRKASIIITNTQNVSYSNK